MKTGKMRQLLALMLAGMLTVGYVGIPVFGVENNTAETAVETEAGTAIGALEEETISEKEEMIPSDAVSYKDHYYKLFALGGSYEDAEEYCLSLGGYLAVISDQEENDFLFSYMKSCGYENAYFGFSDQEDEGVWVWLGTEEKSGYTNWASKEPNSEDSMEDYAMFYWKYPDGKWNDGNFGNGTVSDDTAFLCEWKGTGLVSESEQDEKSFIELPNVALVSELKKLPVGETTEIPLTVRIRKDIDWSDFSIKDNTGEVLAYVSAEEITMDEDEFKIGNIAYDQVHINVGYKDNPSSNSTAVTLYAQMGEQKSNRVTLRRNLAVTKEMLQRYYAVLHDLNDFTEDFPVKILEDGTSVVTIKPDMLFNSVKEYLEGNSSVANVYSSGEDMLLYETIDGLMGYFQMTQVYEDEGKNMAGGIGIPTEQTEYQVQSQYRYDNSFLYAPIDPDVLVLCPLDGSSITDRDGKKTKKIGKKLAKYNGGNCDIVTSKEETNILHILNSGALEDYGTIMFIAHGSPVSRGDGTSSVLFTIGSYDKQEKLNAQLDTWFSQHEGDDLYLRKLDYEDNYTEQISRSDLIPGIHMLAGLQYKYGLYDSFELIPIKQFNLCISTDYIMDVCGEIELPNTVFYIGACYSLKDNRFNHWVVQHHGVGVIGYDNKVQCLGEQEVCESLFKTLMEKDQKSEVATGYRNYTITDAALSVPGTFGLVMMDVSDVLGGADSQSMVAASEKLDYVYRGEGLLQGVIVDENDDPVEGADVHIARYLNGHFTRGQNSVTAADGTYHYDHLEFGQYMIYVQKKDVKAYAVLPHYKTNGKWPAIVLSMCSMTGTVLDAETNEPISGVTVTYEDKDDPSNTATTTADQEGQYTFENVPTGNYNLRFTHENYKDGKAELKVGADPKVYEVETVELEPEDDIDWYQYIKDVLGPQYGFADKDVKKGILTNDSKTSSEPGWNERSGIISADLIDMTEDGSDDLLLYRYGQVPEGTSYRAALFAELYTEENGDVKKLGEIEISSNDLSYAVINGKSYASLRVGTIYVKEKPYIWVELFSNTYYANASAFDACFYGWDGSQFRLTWMNGKSHGGSIKIVYSLRTYTDERNYEEEIFYHQDVAQQYIYPEGNGKMGKEASDFAEAVRFGYELLELPDPVNCTYPYVSGHSNSSDEPIYPSYWDTDVVKKTLEINISGPVYETNHIKDSVTDYSELSVHVEDSLP